MDIKKISPFFSVSAQISPADVGVLASQGFRTIISHRPDGEADDQPGTEELRDAAARHGLAFHAQPVRAGQVSDDDVSAFASLLDGAEGPVLAFCRTGTRSITLWALVESRHLSTSAVLATALSQGYDLEGLRERLDDRAGKRGEDVAARAAGAQRTSSAPMHDVVIVGGGAGGLAAAASLLRRRPHLDIAVIEPSERHYYQPGWTLVGAGVMPRARTDRAMAQVMPAGVKWLKSAVCAFEPDRHAVVLEDGERIGYRALVVAPGIKLNWHGVQGLLDTLGRNGVTSNYRFDLAPYTWELVQNLRAGRAVFTQPPMPIKCAGAPQKAMYLSCDHWLKQGRLQDIDVAFYNAGGVLFGVPEYVPALQKYVDRYSAAVNFNHNLTAVDGSSKKAWFDVTTGDQISSLEVEFDMIHVCPPQMAPDFVRSSPLADAAGWVKVSPETLIHPDFGNVFGLGDACSAPNAKTAAAVRKQAPVVAENVLAVLDGHAPRAIYDGYGSCPLTVERGKVVLAEFGYGGKLLPSLPRWILDGRNPTALAWFMKAHMMIPIYFDLMLKGREWLARPTLLPHDPTPHDSQPAVSS
jgi:sulfide:quinone oxidoreductase